MATVASQLTRIHDVEGTLSLSTIGGGAGAAANADIVLQGAQSVARRQSNATDHGYLLTAGTQDVSGAGVHVGVWLLHVHYTVITKFQARIGSSTAAWHGHSFPVAAYPLTGGWVRVWLDVSRTPEDSSGTFDKAALTQVGVVGSLPSVSGNAPNLFMDASDFTTGGLLLDGVTGKWIDFLAADEGNSTNKYGVVTSKDGIVYCLARLTLGSANSLAFTDQGFVVIFPDQALVAAGFMGVTVDLQNAATVIDWSNGVVRSAGTGRRGDLVVSGASGSFTADGMAFGGLRVIDLTAACTLSVCTINGSGLITANGASLVDCSITGSFAAVALLWNTAAATQGKLDGASFTSAGTGHAIEFGPNTTATLSMVNVGFSGYGADATTDAAVYNNSGKELTISIAGGSTPTVRNGAGASTVLVTDVRAFEFSVRDEASTPVTGYEWRLYEDDPTPGVLGMTELAGEESATASQQSHLYSYDTDQDVVLQIIHDDYIEAVVTATLINADQSLTVVLRREENI